MKAIVYTEYGLPDVLHVGVVEKPVPNDHEILIKIRATPINYGDLTARNFGNLTAQQFNMPAPLMYLAKLGFGLSKPKKNILGSEFAGEVEAAGKAVTRFKAGDPVFGYRGQRMGANAEYICMPEDGMVAMKPANMTFEEAAAIPYGALTALSLLRKASIQPGQNVLVNGASGSIGAAVVQLAKHYGATVTGVCSTPRVEYVKALGADRVVDYTQEDFIRRGESYDLIFDVLGKSSFEQCRRVLKPDGRVLYASFKMKQLFQMLWTSRFGRQKVICALSSETPDDLRMVKTLAEAGTLKAVIDRCYPLEQAAEAHRYVEAGQKTGSVILTA